LSVGLSFADEQLTVTTYYPSPVGVYNELQTNKLSVGDVNDDGDLTSADLPPEVGQLAVARSVVFNPYSDLATIKGLPNPRQGEAAYNAGEDSYYNYNGSDWVPLGGSAKGRCILYYGNLSDCSSGGTNWDNCCPGEFPKFKMWAGTYGYCHYGPFGAGVTTTRPPQQTPTCDAWDMATLTPWGNGVALSLGAAFVCCENP
jgi:hypothetical protein